MKKVVVLEPLGVDKDIVIDNLTALGDVEVVYYDNRNEDEDELIKRSEGANVIIASNIKLSERVLSSIENLEMVNVAFTGVDHVDLDYCRANNILVTNASGYANEGVAELTFGLIIAMYRQILKGDHLTRTQGTHHNILCIEISGKKFGVVGAGAIGKQVIEVAKAFNADVSFFNRSQLDIENAKQVSLEEIFRESDIVSIHLPLNNDTRGMINKDLLNLMKKDAILVNTARGPIIDNDYLADVLNNDKIAGAAIDVFDYEPPIAPDYKLLNAKNTLFMPHVAQYTQQAMEKRFVIVTDNVKGFLTNNPINVIK